MTDVQIFQTDDDGDIRLENGLLVTDDGLSSSFYLSLFGGNLDDDGTEATKTEQWWGNYIEGEPTRRYRSRTQHALQTLPPTTGNLRKIQDAASEDLAWAVELGTVDYVVPIATMPARNTVQLDIHAAVNGQKTVIQLPPIPWGA